MPAAVSSKQQQQPPKANGTSSPKPMSSEHLDVFRKLVSRFCSEEGYKELATIAQENEDLRDTVKELEVTKNVILRDLRMAEASAAESAQAQSQAAKDLESMRAQLAESTSLNESLRRENVATNEEVSAMMEKIKARDAGISKLRKEKEDEVKKAESATARREQLEKELKTRDDELGECSREVKLLQKELSTIRGYSIEMSPLASVKDQATVQLKACYVTSYRLMRNFLYQDLPPSKLDDASFWEALRKKTLVRDSGIQLLASNSAGAKHMRLAFGLMMLGQTIADLVFRTCYTSETSNELVDALRNLGNIEEDRELHARSVLLGIAPDVQARNGKHRAEAAAQSAHQNLRELAPEEKQDAFLTQLRALCTKALELWNPLQRVREGVQVQAEAEPEEDYWQALPAPEAPRTPEGRSSRGTAYENIHCVIWPAFVGEDENFTLLQEGIVLTTEQAKSAEKEMESLRRSERERQRSAAAAPDGSGPARRRGSRRNSKAFLSSGGGAGDVSPSA